MPKRKPVPPPKIELLTGIVEDILVGPIPKRGGAEMQEVSIRVNVLTENSGGGADLSWMRVHKRIAFRLRSLAELQGSDGLIGRCCTVGVDEQGTVVSFEL